DGVNPPVMMLMVGAFFTAFPDLYFELVNIVQAGEGLIAVEWAMRGTNSGSFWGQHPTGKRVKLVGADFIQVQGDKIKSIRAYYDRKALVEQIGIKVIYEANGVLKPGF